MIVFLFFILITIFYGSVFIFGHILESTLFLSDDDYRKIAHEINDTYFDESKTYEIEVEISTGIATVVLFYEEDATYSPATYDHPEDDYVRDVHIKIDSIYFLELDADRNINLQRLIEVAAMDNIKLELL